MIIIIMIKTNVNDNDNDNDNNNDNDNDNDNDKMLKIIINICARILDIMSFLMFLRLIILE